MATHEKLSFCRICMGTCGMVVTTDDAGRILDIRADRDDPQTWGFACHKGLRAAEAQANPNRFLRPMKRLEDGTLVPIALETALDEIAARLDGIRQESGAEAIAGYRGGGGFFTSSAVLMLTDLLKALGSPKMFSSATIDQSAKYVAQGRLGLWPPGKTPVSRCDVMLLVGTNPMVSVNPPFDTRNPVKRMKEARARGMKLIVIDPRRSETAAFADVHLQPLPGEDVTVIAGLHHIILREGWHDEAFCAQHVADLDALRGAVARFTPDYVAVRADVAPELLLEAARLFAQEGRKGFAGSSTGPDMGPHSNLAEHLIEALNIICGKLVREGEEVGNSGAVLPRLPRKAQVTPPPRWWEDGPKSRIDGSGMLADEMMTGVLADEILVPGDGQVRALIVHGGNPASAVPDQRKVVRALRSLDLLVCIEPTATVTTDLADYILPPYTQYERPDLPFWLYEQMIYQDVAYTRYTPAVASPPAGAELVDDWFVFWSLAKRLGVPIDYLGTPLDMQTPPTTDDLLARVAGHAPVSFEEIQRQERGLVVDSRPLIAEPADPDWAGRFSVMADDVRGEVDDVLAEPVEDEQFPFRFAVRRLRETFNSVGRDLPATRKRVPYNKAFINPEDLATIGAVAGDEVEIVSNTGSIVAVAEPDATLRRRVISVPHGFGGLPDVESNRGYYEDGISTNLLLNDKVRETINAMPRMTGFKVALRRIGGKG
ncbi:Anaerobic selenocysteine-containing dehydrogenase [Sphingomonas laterariae]|uniref:Anaerobic selenocysteine-containing dehydrogenase n=1 Tax=Edaphosphingomonas laterariae TaxID=861865 RepID=A0A239DMK4_9SPHN|nr:molybdopterin-dependent oxidoreductase [Sphingomonas laterariae]SNS33865.1 Anaerobic selenocysteine-containing dehydrogenase [Sphingomonas laterariae]